MSLATASHEPLQDTTEFDQLISLQSSNFTSNYIHTCKLEPRKKLKQMPPNRPDSDVIVTSDLPVPKQDLPTFKLLQFSENHRPAYYGSWRRKDDSITPKNPFKKVC